MRPELIGAIVDFYRLDTRWNPGSHACVGTWASLASMSTRWQYAVEGLGG